MVKSDYKIDDGLKQMADREDPWKHRSKGMLCRFCMWYAAKENESPKSIGRCRKHAPTISGYPAVFPSDWCGDHKLDENKL